MTKEEAIAKLTNMMNHCYPNEEYRMAIEALEQEPSDAISRQAVLDIVNNPLNIRLDEIIKKLPPVTPAENPDINDENIYVCSCGYGWDKSKVVRHHFCPNCGAKVAEGNKE